MVFKINNSVNLKRMKSKHLVMISIDALNASDLKVMKELSCFGEIINQGAYAKEAVGIYPSLTYPSHASIITGVYPKKHKIYDNKPFQPGIKDKEWFFFDKDIAVDTLYGLAASKGLTTGSFFWPVTAGAKIKYNCPPIWPIKSNQSQVFLSLKYGSPCFLLDIQSKFGWMRNGKEYPNLDNFTAMSAAYLLKKKKPNILLVAFSELDHMRHMYGVNSEAANKSLISTNERIGILIQAAKDAGIYEDTTFVVLGDHGFLDYNKNVSLNVIFASRGYIYLNSFNKIVDWQVYAQAGGGSAQIYLRDKHNQRLYNEVEGLLQELLEDQQYGIETVFTGEQAREKGVSGDFSFIVEAKQGYHFGDSLTGEAVMSIATYNQNRNNREVATHGYDPLKPNYRTTVIFSGAGIRQGVVLDDINLIDVAPTLATLLDLNLPNVDGKVIYQVLKDCEVRYD